MSFRSKKRNQEQSLFAQKQALAKQTDARYYGGDGTWHQTGEVNVELHEGRVVSVWFRCQMLPFTQRVVDQRRANEMIHAYDGAGNRLTGVEIVDV